jgi:hypothetical protein
MANESLTQERLHEVVEYNPNTGIFIWKKSIAKIIKIGNIAGSKRKDGYLCFQIDKKMYLAHRLAWFYVYGYFPKLLDHINQIRHDNRIINLREATKSENGQNRPQQKNNTSGIKGVHWAKREKKWLSFINLNGKMKHLGYFIDINDAINARKTAEIKLHSFSTMI